MAINLNILMWVIVESGILWKCGFHISRGELWIHCIDLVSRQRDHYGFRFYMNKENVWYRWATDLSFYLAHLKQPGSDYFKIRFFGIANDFLTVVYSKVAYSAINNWNQTEYDRTWPCVSLHIILFIDGPSDMVHIIWSIWYGTYILPNNKN